MEPALEGILGYINQESNEILIKCKEDFLIIKRKYEENNNYIFNKIHIDMAGEYEELDLPKDIIIEKLEISNYKYSLDNLPDNIKTLYLKDYYHEINNLPLNLEYLGISGKRVKYEQSLDYLPSNLKTLRLNTCNIQDDYNLHVYDNLPDNLKKLHISNPPHNYSFANLPKKLESLSLFLWGTDFGLVDYPENLKEFHISMLNNKCKDIEELPNNITKLTLTIYNYLNLTEIINQIDHDLKKVANKNLNKLEELVFFLHYKDSDKDEKKIIKIKEYIEEKNNIVPYELKLSYYDDTKEYIFI